MVLFARNENQWQEASASRKASVTISVGVTVCVSRHCCVPSSGFAQSRYAFADAGGEPCMQDASVTTYSSPPCPLVARTRYTFPALPSNGAYSIRAPTFAKTSDLPSPCVGTMWTHSSGAAACALTLSAAAASSGRPPRTASRAAVAHTSGLSTSSLAACASAAAAAASPPPPPSSAAMAARHVATPSHARAHGASRHARVYTASALRFDPRCWYAHASDSNSSRDACAPRRSAASYATTASRLRPAARCRSPSSTCAAAATSSQTPAVPAVRPDSSAAAASTSPSFPSASARTSAAYGKTTATSATAAPLTSTPPPATPSPLRPAPLSLAPARPAASAARCGRPSASSTRPTRTNGLASRGCTPAAAAVASADRSSSSIASAAVAGAAATGAGAPVCQQRLRIVRRRGCRPYGRQHRRRKRCCSSLFVRSGLPAVRFCIQRTSPAGSRCSGQQRLRLC
eukprot:352534-Chlamydomonas_euryale.AAC.9